MAADQSACYLHELDKVHLIAVWCLSRILQNKQSAAVGQPFACAIPAHEIIWASLPTLDEKPAQFALAAQDTVRFVVEYGWDERALKNGIFGVEGKQPFGVDRLSAIVPLAMDARAISQEAALGFLVLTLVHKPIARAGQPQF